MNTYSILNVKISDISIIECLGTIDNAINTGKKIQICTTNNEFIIEAQKNNSFKNILNNSAISTADSTGVVWAIKRQYKKTLTRIPGIDLFLEICKVAPKKYYRIFLLGGDKNVALKTKNILQKKYIGIHIVGSIDGISIDESKKNNELIATINRADPDIVAVALGAPKQELCISKNMPVLKGNVFIGLGGSFDYIAGTIPRAPKFMRHMGLEWLFRLLSQPQRIKRVFKAVIIFPLLILFKSK